MKKNLILFIGLMLLMSFSLVSCGDPNAPQKPNKQNNSMSYMEKWMKISQYLVNNYQVGDSIVFKSETNALDTFVVTTSINTASVSFHDPIDEGLGIEHDIPSIPDTISISSMLEIVNSKYKILIGLGSMKYHGGDCGLYITAPASQESIQKNYDDYAFISINKMQDEHFIVTPFGSCHLRRGEGVIDFSDTEGHTWTLVEKLKIQY